MSRTTTVYAYPWDVLDDPASVDRIRGLGVDSVTLAVNYHSVRAATPMHPLRRVVDAEHAALYLDHDREVWEGSALTPASADRWAGPDSAARARAVLLGAGIDVRAWVVITHNSLLGSRHPDLCVTNAFGERYRYALCPGAPQVADYARRLIENVTRRMPGDGIVLEASGQLGIDHAGLHEKTAGADWSEAERDLLSICFCGACREAMLDDGLDPQVVAERVRDGLRGAVPSVDSALGSSIAARVLALRQEASVALLDAVCAVARRSGARSIAVHVDPRPWATGAGAAVAGLPVDVDCMVLPAMASELPVVQGTPRLGRYLSGMPGALADWSTVAAASEELHVYHFGLLSADRLQRVADELRGLPEA